MLRVLHAALGCAADAVRARYQDLGALFLVSNAPTSGACAAAVSNQKVSAGNVIYESFATSEPAQAPPQVLPCCILALSVSMEV